MVDIKSVFAHLRRIAQSWGGDLVVVNDYREHGDFRAPFCTFLSIDFVNKRVFYELELLDSPAEAAGVIHEMGHVFACCDMPRVSEEYDFFGWEWALAVEVGLLDEWLESVGSYTLPADGNDFTEDFGTLSVDEQSELFEERVNHARDLGLIVCDTPVCIRGGEDVRKSFDAK